MTILKKKIPIILLLSMLPIKISSFDSLLQAKKIFNVLYLKLNQFLYDLACFIRCGRNVSMS